MQPKLLSSFQLVILVIVAGILIPKHAFTQHSGQIVQVRQSDVYQSLKDVKEITLENVVRDMNFDSISNSVIIALLKKKHAERMAKEFFRYEEITSPEEYKRWFPKPWISNYRNYLLSIDPESTLEQWVMETPLNFDALTGIYTEPAPYYNYNGRLTNFETSLNLKTGITTQNKIDEAIFGLFPDLNIVLSIGKKNTVYCRNLNGKEKWRFVLENPGNGWNDLIKINDSTLVLAVSGLHFLDISKGRIAYQSASTVDNISKVIGLLGDKYGTKQFTKFRYYFGSGLYSSTMIWGLASNVVSDSGSVYFAAHNNIVCTDHKGKPLWEILSDSLAAGRLLLQDSVLIYINKGYGIMPEKVSTGLYSSSLADYMGFKTLFAIPELHAYNRLTGKQVYRETLSNEYDIILDIRHLPNNDTIQILTRTKIILTSISKGHNLAIKEYSQSGNADLCFFAANDVWLKDSTGIYFPVASDNSKVCIMLDRSRLWLLDKYLNNVAIYYRKDIWHFQGKYKDAVILRNGTGVVILSDEGKQLMYLPGSGPACLAGSKLFVGSGNLVTVFNLDDLAI